MKIESLLVLSSKSLSELSSLPSLTVRCSPDLILGGGEGDSLGLGSLGNTPAAGLFGLSASSREGQKPESSLHQEPQPSRRYPGLLTLSDRKWGAQNQT